MDIERKQMAASLRRLGVFLLPVLLLLLAPVLVLWESGEIAALSPERVIKKQREATSPVLFGPAFSNCAKRYKVLGARAAAADVLVLGTSRSMQIRAGLFLPQTSFYNAGGGASRVGHLRNFLAGLSAEEQPKLLLVGLDQWFFNSRTESYPELSFKLQVQGCSSVLNVVQASWASLYADIASGRINLNTLGGQAGIGLNAQVHSNGFRNDGSYFYGRITENPGDPAASDDFQYRETLRRIADGTGRFEYARSPDPALVDELGRFLDEAKKRGIHVLGFIPPFAPAVNDAMTKSGHYEYIPGIYSAIRPEFEARGFVVVDQTDLRFLGIDASEFIDGVHASERAHVLMLQDMLRADENLGTYTNKALLDRVLVRSPNPLAVVTDRVR